MESVFILKCIYSQIKIDFLSEYSENVFEITINIIRIFSKQIGKSLNIYFEYVHYLTKFQRRWPYCGALLLPPL